jgi:hypothetical protein
VYADSAYRSAAIEAKLKARGLRSRIHQRASRNHALSKAQEAAERAARIERILSFLQHGEIGRDMSESDFTLCKSLDDKLRIRGQS